MEGTQYKLEADASLELPLISNLYRSVSDCHLEEIANYCHDLEQLDILGTNEVTMQGVSK